eukprot:CAMPEP_0113450246 /NCGR_PEP_ID=MMETSP0014_2-20120614/5727_1 /TAXON_ID=2857 /ORGANISM="Nitzschia sp." /LENGTH=1814 /DNA_ID=CAMNT_0000341571 /DNA_START=197 /DNA_END=5637 /DNA_ORIENTATION=- /assembly_acc=CAM_ASM_000159
MRIDRWAVAAFVASAMMATNSDNPNSMVVTGLMLQPNSYHLQIPFSRIGGSSSSVTSSTRMRHRPCQYHNDGGYCPTNRKTGFPNFASSGSSLQMAAEEYVSLDEEGSTPKSSSKNKRLTPAEEKRVELQQAIKEAETKRTDARNMEVQAEEKIENLEEQIRAKKKRLEEFETEQQRQAELKRSLSSNAANGAVVGVSSTVAAVGTLVAARSFLEKRKNKIEEERQRLEEELKKKEELLAKTTIANKKTYSLVSAAAIGSAVVGGSLANGNGDFPNPFQYFDSLSLDGVLGKSDTSQNSAASDKNNNAAELPYLENKIDAAKARREEEERLRAEKMQEEARALAAQEEERLRAAAAEEKARIRAQEEEVYRLKQQEEAEAERARVAAQELERLRVENLESKKKAEVERAELMKQKIAEARRVQAEKEAERKKQIEQFTSAPKALAGGLLDALGGESKNAGVKLAGVGAVLAGAVATAATSFKILQDKGDGRKELGDDERVVNESLFDPQENNEKKPPEPPSDYSFTRPTTTSTFKGRSNSDSSGATSPAGGNLNGNKSPPDFSPKNGSQGPQTASPFFPANENVDTNDSKPLPESFVFQKKNGAPPFSSNGISTKDKDGNMRNIPPPVPSSLPDKKREPSNPAAPSSFSPPKSDGNRQVDLNGSKKPESDPKNVSPFGGSSWIQSGTQVSTPKDGGNLQSRTLDGNLPPQTASPETKKGSFSPFGQNPMSTAPGGNLNRPPSAPSGSQPKSMPSPTSWSPNVDAGKLKSPVSPSATNGVQPATPSFGSVGPSPPSKNSSFGSPSMSTTSSAVPPPVEKQSQPFGSPQTTSDSTSTKKPFSTRGPGSINMPGVKTPSQQSPDASNNTNRSKTPSSPFGSVGTPPKPQSLKQQTSSPSGSSSSPLSSQNVAPAQSFAPYTKSDVSSRVPSSSTSRGDDMYARLRREQEEVEPESQSSAIGPVETKNKQPPKKSFSPFGGSKPKSTPSGNALYTPPSTFSSPGSESNKPDDKASVSSKKSFSPFGAKPEPSYDKPSTPTPKTSFSPFGNKWGASNDKPSTPTPKTSFSPFDGTKATEPSIGNNFNGSPGPVQDKSKESSFGNSFNSSPSSVSENSKESPFGNNFNGLPASPSTSPFGSKQDESKFGQSSWSPFSAGAKQPPKPDSPSGTGPFSPPEQPAATTSFNSPAAFGSMPPQEGAESSSGGAASKKSFSPFGSGQKPQAPEQKKESIFPKSDKDKAKSAPANEQQNMFAKLREDAKSRQNTLASTSPRSPRKATDFKPAGTTRFSFSPPGRASPSPNMSNGPSPPAGEPVIRQDNPIFDPTSLAQPFAASTIPSGQGPNSSGNRMDEVNRRSEQQAGSSGNYGEDVQIQKERSRLKGLEEARKRAMAAASTNKSQNEGTTNVSGPKAMSFQTPGPTMTQPQRQPEQDKSRSFTESPAKTNDSGPKATPFQTSGPAMTKPQQQQQQQQQQPEQNNAAPSQSWMQSKQQVSSSPSAFQRQQQSQENTSNSQVISPVGPGQATQSTRNQVPLTPMQQDQPMSRPSYNGTPINERNTILDSDQDSEINQIILEADTNYIPSKRALIADSSEPLLQEVDGDISFVSNLEMNAVSNTEEGPETTVNSENSKETIYRASNVNVYGESSVSIPIMVTAAGSIVEYTVEKKNHDFLFGIDSRVGQGQEIVKEMDWFDGRNRPLSAAESANSPPKTVTDSILVGPGNTPCILNLHFENKKPWALQLSYSARVIAPSKATVIEGRRNRATSALRYLDSDTQALEDRRSYVADERRQLENDIRQLQQQMDQAVDNSRRPIPPRVA